MNDPLTSEQLRRMSPRVTAWFSRRVWNSADVEDLVQEVLYRCVKKASAFRGESDVQAWCYGICRYVWFEFVRDAKRRSVADCVVAEQAPERDPVERISLRVAASRLPIRLRQVYELRYEHDLGLESIASMLSRPMGTIKYQLSEARAHMRRFLAEE